MTFILRETLMNTFFEGIQTLLKMTFEGRAFMEGKESYSVINCKCSPFCAKPTYIGLTAGLLSLAQLIPSFFLQENILCFFLIHLLNSSQI